MKHLDFSVIILLIGVTLSLSNLLLYCFFGRLATDSHLKLVDCLYDANWSDFPVELQKYFLFMIQNAQRPIHYHGSQISVLNLSTFSSVSYFLCQRIFSILKNIVRMVNLILLVLESGVHMLHDIQNYHRLNQSSMKTEKRQKQTFIQIKTYVE